MNVGLAMIVRDAEDTLPRLLASLDGVADPARSTIIDTGSEDATVDVISGWGALPIRSKWESFQHNRSELMALAARKADRLLLLDADMELVWDDRPGLDLEAECVYGEIRQGGVSYDLPLFVTGRRPWEYKGYAHAYLVCSDGEEVTRAKTQAFWIRDYSSTSEEKIRRDVGLLWKELLDCGFENPRAWYYLAQSCKDLGMVDAAIMLYRLRSELDGGFEEERWHALYQAGALLAEHRSYAKGAPLLVEAYRQRPHRAEPLRALGHSSLNVASKTPLPEGDKLFVIKSDYRQDEAIVEFPVVPPVPVIAPNPLRRHRRNAKPSARDVSAIIVTRGNVDLAPILDGLPYLDVIVWDNSARENDYKAFGRYAAIPEAKKDVVYWQDDDVLFGEHKRLLAAYEPGRLVCNMDDPWIDACGYRGLVGMQGAGSIVDADVPERVFARYLDLHPADDDFYTEADFIFGVLAPFTVVDLGYEAREFADAPDRLYTQPWQPARKAAMIARCRELRDA